MTLHFSGEGPAANAGGRDTETRVVRPPTSAARPARDLCHTALLLLPLVILLLKSQYSVVQRVSIAAKVWATSSASKARNPSTSLQQQSSSRRGRRESDTAATRRQGPTPTAAGAPHRTAPRKAGFLFPGTCRGRSLAAWTQTALPSEDAVPYSDATPVPDVCPNLAQGLRGQRVDVSARVKGARLWGRPASPIPRSAVPAPQPQREKESASPVARRPPPPAPRPAPLLRPGPTCRGGAKPLPLLLLLSLPHPRPRGPPWRRHAGRALQTGAKPPPVGLSAAAAARPRPGLASRRLGGRTRRGAGRAAGAPSRSRRPTDARVRQWRAAAVLGAGHGAGPGGMGGVSALSLGRVRRLLLGSAGGTPRHPGAAPRETSWGFHPSLHFTSTAH